MAALATPAAVPALPVFSAILPVTAGSAGIVLALYGVAALADRLGHGLPGLAAALDPAVTGALPELWGQSMLLLAALAAVLQVPRTGRPDGLAIAALPLALLVGESGDLAARLAPLFASAPSEPLGKLAAALAIGCVVATAAAVSLRVPGTPNRALLGALLLGGAVSLGGDLLADILEHAGHGSRQVHALVLIEETAELLLYAVVAAAALTAAAHLPTHRMSSQIGTSGA